MSVEKGVEALVEYIVYQERPGEARTSWLKEEINSALMLRGPHLRFAVLAVVNQVLWTNWLDADTRSHINRAVAEMEGAQRGPSMPTVRAEPGLARPQENEQLGKPRVSAESALKYNLDKLRCGISVEKAVELLLSACNKPDTMFVTERWIRPRLEELRTHLTNPITSDQAQALQDAILQRCPFKDVLGWLRGEAISWKDYQVRKKVLQAEARRARDKEVRKRWENTDWEKIARLQAAGVHVLIPPQVFLGPNEEKETAVDAETDKPLHQHPDSPDQKT
jgi:hypothetical protein